MPAIEISPTLTLHFQEFNPGGSPNVLLLHGLGATSESWGLQLPALTGASMRVLAPDTRGFGRSGYSGGRMKPSLLAADVACLMEKLEAFPSHVIGISMGGVIAQELALGYPQHVSKLVLVNTFARLLPVAWQGWFYFLIRFIVVHTLGLPAQARIVAKRLFPRSDQAAMRQVLYNEIVQANPAAYRSVMRELAIYNSLDRVHKISAPTLVITADGDQTVHPVHQALLAKRIPGARQVIIPNASHGVIADQPEAFNQTVLDFLLECGDKQIGTVKG
jgi:3-oxoadipate enol-lactonase